MDPSFPARSQLQEQRRALSEETVSYAIYLSPTTTSDNNSPKLDHDQNRSNAAIESVYSTKTLINEIAAELTKDYIWHKDAFSLWIEEANGNPHSKSPYLRGETRVGDSLDDEWLIVFLLREITKRIPGSIARVQDNDGEFLLIEAADQIPSWLDPDNSENRVFIFEGNLHIIPIAITAEEKKAFPSTVGSRSTSPKLEDALSFIRSSSTSPIISTLASSKIQHAAFGALSQNTVGDDFATRKRQEQRHYARCQVPIDIARILNARPELVTKACEAFYTRDALGMAACSRMVKFLPATPSGAIASMAIPPPDITRLGKHSTPFVTTAICFTKTCYAQLMGQQFQPPKVWDGIVPPPNFEDANDPNNTCGFEILCSSDYTGDFGFKTGEKINIEATRQYFGDELPGSQLYKQLEETARQQYIESKETQLGSAQDGPTSFRGHGYHPVQEINRILSTEVQVSDFATLINDRRDDDDTWMNVDLQMLEDMMRARGFGGTNTSSQQDANAASNGLDMQQMLHRFEGFIQEGDGGIDGAEFLDEHSEDDDDSDNDSDESDARETATSLERDDNMEDHDNTDDDEDDEDIFASDYEERQVKKREARQSKVTGGGGAFVFENRLDSEPTDVAIKKLPKGFATNREQLKDVLARTFGEDFLASRAKERLAKSSVEKDEISDEDEQIDEGELQGYMKALDAELAGTKIGQSFEKVHAGAFTTTTSTTTSSTTLATAKEDKGKDVARFNTQETSEKTLEELVKEYTDRSRRGFSRRGPLDVSGSAYRYDPAAMIFENDDGVADYSDESDMEPVEARVSAISPEDELGDDMVDVDLNLAKNLLESFKSQGGLPGPGGNILARLGIVLPRDEEGEDSEDEN
ncbi:hypothetical protein BGZ98_005873 [Dissophora globulifera]|nr:hypothetical protein BGZ98_005873 [Dissophora globulifera]